ncbi:terminase small subunit [Cyanobacteria bacterium FACHB-DQ100]|nr:terminase small subunit [Cyanobacteria bacterium FACHB-DQ100]
MFDGKLTQKQRRFAEAIFKGESATDAYVLAGYKATKRTIAGVEGCKLLKNPSISAYLSYLKGQVEEKIVIDEARLIRELQSIAFARIDHLLDLDTGEMLPKDELLKSNALACVSDFSVDEIESGEGIKRKRKLKMFSKVQAIETLLKISGYSQELALGLRICESYGIKLRQNERSEWEVIK